MANAKRDDNNVTTLLWVSSVDWITPVPIKVNPVTNRVLIELVWGSVWDMQASVYDPTNKAQDIFAYADSLVVWLWDDRWNFDASWWAYPSTWGSWTAWAILKWDTWTISVAWTLPTGQVVEVWDIVRALIDTPWNTQANWAIQQNNIWYTAENSANKSTTLDTDKVSDTKYPSVKSVYDWATWLFWQLTWNNTFSWNNLFTWAFNAKVMWPEWFLINWKIVTSVTSNNLTVAIKTLTWTDPSATDPVYCRIWWVVRTITSALSIVSSAWFNWNNAWSSELATKEIDYFTYLWYNTTAGAVRIWFSRINWRVSSDFSSSPTNEKYYNTNDANISATDIWVNIWRFNATLSAVWTWHLWSLPATSVIINYPIFESRLLDWVPTYSASWSMTYTSVTTNTAKYRMTSKWCIIYLDSVWTTWWTASVQINATTPFTSLLKIKNWSWTYDAWSSRSWFVWMSASSNIAGFLKCNDTNWGLWAWREISCELNIEV